MMADRTAVNLPRGESDGVVVEEEVIQWERAFDGAEMVRSLTCDGSRRFGEVCERFF
jgi:hypothetical protein